MKVEIRHVMVSYVIARYADQTLIPECIVQIGGEEMEALVIGRSVYNMAHHIDGVYGYV